MLTIQARRISIHAPRTGSDHTPAPSLHPNHNFNPRSPHGERRKGRNVCIAEREFQSTLPARGATARKSLLPHCRVFQSTLPARGATKSIFHPVESITISIHAPRTGSDLKTIHDETGMNISIHAPRTGSDMKPVLRTSLKDISIHAPRTGSDERAVPARRCVAHFNPRSPHGERLFRVEEPRLHGQISIHAPRTGSDCRRDGIYRAGRQFQSTLPARGAT